MHNPDGVGAEPRAPIANKSGVISRRAVVVSTAAGGVALLIGLSLRRFSDAPQDDPVREFSPDLWIRIDDAGVVSITVHKCEMGQGVITALPMLIAEELEVDVRSVRVEQADADFRVPNQNTSGSSSIAESWELLRRAGAVARIALIRAAAQRWGVPESECKARDGTVIHSPTGRTSPYGSLVAATARLELPSPDEVELKPPWDFRTIGQPIARHDAFAKATGGQRYGIDVRAPGMLYAAVLRCPVLSGRLCTVDAGMAQSLPGVRLVSVDLAAARKLPGVRHVAVLEEDIPSRLPPRVAVVASSTWHAFEAIKHIEALWEEGSNATLSSEQIGKKLRHFDSVEPVIVRNSGQAMERVGDRPAASVEYEVPFLAHASMEPINCTAHFKGDSLEIWAPTQFPQRAVDHAARVSGLARERIQLHVIPMGGAFGRRASPDFVVEAVQISRSVKALVQVVWTREQEIQQDFYRPATFQRLAATLDSAGRPEAWLHQMAGPSIIEQIFPPGRFPIEGNEIDAAVNIPYRIPHVRVEWRNIPVPVPLTVWRSVAQSQNLFAVESFLDELAVLGRHDPVEYRRALLDGEPRLRNVLEVAARAAGWGTVKQRARGQGVALNKYGDGTFVGLIATVVVGDRGTFRVERLTCAVDCGQPINPLSLRAQIEGGLVWGLSAALHGRITIEQGRVEQSNFHDYPVLRMHEMPALDIHIVESHAAPGGIGEPCVPVVAPAVANAIHAAIGRRLRALPFNLSA